MYWIVSPEKKKIFSYANNSSVIFYETLGDDDDSWVRREEKVVIYLEEKSTILWDVTLFTLENRKLENLLYNTI
jgi:hypothetical protein